MDQIIGFGLFALCVMCGATGFFLGRAYEAVNGIHTR